MGSGWDPSMAAPVGGCDGVFYIVRPDGTLSWSQLEQPVDMVWDYRISNLASGWSRFAAVIGSNTGVVYARTFDGDLYWYRLLHPDVGTGEFAVPDGRLIADNP